MKEKNSYQPTPEQSRWLKQWEETGRELIGFASVKTSADFEKMRAANLKLFKEWALALFDILNCSQPRKRRKVELITEDQADELAPDRTFDDAIKDNQE